MNGVDVIGGLLRSSADLTDAWPAESIKAGMLPEGELGILVRSISLIDYQTLAQEALVRSTERVSVTVRAKTYRDQVIAMKLIRRACAGVIATAIGDARNISVLTAGTGPDVIGPGNTFEQAQDFRVSFDAPA
ncbi:hypothetical protein GCM10011380_08840 [Sphingomonas metalli]|uniref:DUF3168 domain-containing protein n=1 Tax=Sphingomonas metalli TaxID=1779358 RepID=A0A916WPX8_9SPHN|nr:hypothetical protein [Sphingomonas metalli]GGB21496.1 hypothetical protein GCM10011380_08840 [Sphingomonas metalli]